MKQFLLLVAICYVTQGFSQTKYTVNISTSNPYSIPPAFFGANADMFPGFLYPEDNSGCDPHWSGSACQNSGCTSGAGTLYQNFPSNLFNDVNELGIQALYYPGGSNSRMYHYFPGASNHGHSYNLNELGCVEGWGNNNNSKDEYCAENYYQMPNFFEKFVQLCAATTHHAVISVNPYFMSYSEVKNMLQHCTSMQVTVDALLFGTEIENDMDETPYCSSYGLPFSSATTYFNSVKSKFIDSLKANVQYQNIPLYFSAAGYYPDPVDEYGFGGLNCGFNYSACSNQQQENTWNQQLNTAIVNYNSSHNPDLETASAVNWWWYPQQNTNNDTITAKTDMIEFLTSGVESYRQCYGSHFTKLYVSQWGMKKSPPVVDCSFDFDYSNTLLNQFFIMERLFGMIEYNRSSGTNFYGGTDYFRLASNNKYNLLDGDGSGYNKNNTSNYAFREMKPITDLGTVYLKPSFTPSIPSNDLYEVHGYVFQNTGECERKLYLINYSGKSYRLKKIVVDGVNVPKPYHGTITWAKHNNILEKYVSGNTGVREDSVLSSFNVFLKPYSISIIDLGYLPGENCSLNPKVIPAVVNQGETIELFPNPASDFVTIRCMSVLREVEVFDFSGRTVIIQTGNESNAQSLNIAALASGIYFARIKTDQRVVVKKFVVER